MIETAIALAKYRRLSHLRVALYKIRVNRGRGNRAHDWREFCFFISA
jgi:hypothetical protein